ncbi:MAG: bifunctional 4-hydroxy-3-methylbut-2-enyl diphosphate reductase/30S ribosomal protein S1, partial [Clostridia bacterium]|nr:bifunctional 4-hydroxy-3-methylbut-2-enyl diphosphate reductase/30S ribosomal protein S1 [Clostridia bacterium]
MQVFVAKSSGFCRGVKIAVDTAMNIQPENTYILGEIIHNTDVTRSIKARGITVVESLDEVPDGATVIFRSHGVPLAYYTECDRRNIKYIDCTCKFVNNTQRIVKREHEKGNSIIICGEPTHPEVIGLQGWCDNSALVISSENDDISSVASKNVSVVAQTTFESEKFSYIIKKIVKLPF